MTDGTVVACKCLACEARTDWLVPADEALTDFLSNVACAHCGTVDTLEPEDLDGFLLRRAAAYVNARTREAVR